MLTKETVAENVKSIQAQLSRFIRLEDGAAYFANNNDWFAEVKLLDFVEPQEVRYIRLTLRDRAYNGIYGCNLGDFIPY